MAEKSTKIKKEGIIALKDRIKTYIPEFDKSLGGGIPKGHVTLVSGAAGTMKSSFCFNILYKAAMEGLHGVYITLEESSESLLKQARSMGCDLEKAKIITIPDTTTLFTGVEKINSGDCNILIIDIANIRREVVKLAKANQTRHDWFNVIQRTLQRIKNQGMLDILILDSLTAMYAISDFKDPRKDMFNMFSTFKELCCTSLLVSEGDDETKVFERYGIESYMADGIIKLGHVRKEMKILGELHVVKMRATEINKDVFVIEYKNGEFKINPYWINPTPLH